MLIFNLQALRFDTYDGTNTRGTLGLESGGGNLALVGNYDLTGVFVLWSTNDYEVSPFPL